jgi:hypothetical protein
MTPELEDFILLDDLTGINELFKKILVVLFRWKINDKVNEFL